MIRIRTITLFLLLLLPNGYGIIAEDSQPDTKKPIQDDKIAEYRQKLASNPNDIELHRAYQNLMRETGKIEDVREEYTLKLAAEPQNPLYFYLYGRLLEGKELETAFKKAIELEIKSPNQELRFWLYFGLGQVYKDAKKYKEALNHLETAAKLKPDSLDVPHQMALIYYEMDNIAEAMKLWDKILQTKKDYFDAMLGKALIYKSRGMYDNAIKELENILKMDVAFWRAYEPLIQCYHAKQDYKKGGELRSIIKHLPSKATKDSGFKKSGKLITIDIVTINKKVFVVEEAVIPPPLPPNAEISIAEYYFKQLNVPDDKSPQLVYTASIYYNFLAANKAQDTHAPNLYRLNIYDGTENLKSISYEYQPRYQEILSLIKIIEESK